MASHYFLRYQFLSLEHYKLTISFLHFSCRGLALNRRYHIVCAEILYWEGFTWDVAFTPFSNIFCSFGAVSFISSSYGATYTRFDEDIIHGATKHTNTFLSVAEGAEPQGPEAGGKLASFWVYGCRARAPGAVSAPANHKWNTVQAQASASCCALPRESRLIQIFDRLLSLNTCLAEPASHGLGSGVGD
jgi:hypothetical protein